MKAILVSALVIALVPWFQPVTTGTADLAWSLSTSPPWPHAIDIDPGATELRVKWGVADRIWCEAHSIDVEGQPTDGGPITVASDFASDLRVWVDGTLVSWFQFGHPVIRTCHVDAVPFDGKIDGQGSSGDDSGWLELFIDTGWIPIEPGTQAVLDANGTFTRQADGTGSAAKLHAAAARVSWR